jgi:hypothetical protein
MNKIMKAKVIFKHKKKPSGSFPAHLLDGPEGPLSLFALIKGSRLL